MINVKGILTDAEGVPLPKAIIEFYSTRNAGESLNGAAAVTRTDDHGGYDFTLKSGEYEVYAQVAKSTDVYFVGECTVSTSMTGDYGLEALMSMAVPLLPESVVKAIDAADSAADTRVQVEALRDSAEQYSGSAKAYRDESDARANAAAMSEQAALDSESKAKASEETAALHEQASEDSAIASDKSASEASQSESNAATYAQDALNHKNAAGVSEYNAKSSAEESSTHANAAAMSEQAALESESKARTSEEAAALYEQASEDSAIASGKSASEASQSESNAATYAQDALNHKNAASNSENNAKDSELSAKASEQSALEHKSAAGVSADNAKSSELAAKVSEQGALDHKNAASVSENNAKSEAEVSIQNALVATEQAGIATEQADLAASQANAAATSADDANSAAKRAESSAAAMTGALLEMGAVNLSSGAAPAPYEDEGGSKRACFWKVVVSGVIDGVDYGVGDSIVYSAELDTYYKIDNTESVTSVNGKKGVVALSAVDVGALPAGNNAVSASRWATPRTITIDGDAQGSVAIDGSASVTLSLSVKDATHAHAISNIIGLRDELDDKTAIGHGHTASEVGARPANWVPSFKQVTGKPASYPTVWSMIGGKPATATRWPTVAEIGALPANGKAVDASKLNGRSDYYHPANKPSAADVGALPAGGKAKDSDKADYATNANKLNGRADYYHPANKPSAADVGVGNLSQGPQKELKITSAYGYVQVGGKNSGWCHFYTDLPKFYFDKGVTANGDVTLYSDGGTRLDHSNGNIYEHGKRVYSPNNKPSAADVGALGKTEVADSVKPATSTKFGGVKIEFDGTTLNIVTG